MAKEKTEAEKLADAIGELTPIDTKELQHTLDTRLPRIKAKLDAILKKFEKANMKKRIDEDLSPLRKRRTDRFGNMLRRDDDQFAASYDAAERNKNVSTDILDFATNASEGKSLRFYGRTNGKENELVVKKISRMGSTIFVTKSGTEVELVPGGSGLQIINKSTRRVLLDRGNDVMTETVLLSFSQFLVESTTTALMDDVLEVIESKGGGFARRQDGFETEDIVVVLRRKYPSLSRERLQRDIDDALDFWSESGEIMQDRNGYWKISYSV